MKTEANEKQDSTTVTPFHVAADAISTALEQGLITVEAAEAIAQNIYEQAQDQPTEVRTFQVEFMATRIIWGTLQWRNRQKAKEFTTDDL